MTVGLILSILASLANLLGGWIASRLREGNTLFRILLPAAAGLLLAAALTDVLPEAIATTEWAGATALAAYVVLYGAESLLTRSAHMTSSDPVVAAAVASEAPHRFVQPVEPNEPQITREAAYIATLGLSIHSFFDGVALLSAFRGGMGAGILLVIAMVLHTLPVGVSLGSLTRAAHLGRRSAIFYPGLLTLMTILGSLLIFWTANVSEQWTSLLVGASAGTLLYIGATDIIPRSKQETGVASLRWVMVGAAFFMGSLLLMHQAGLG
ncbi:MAG: ZIP family metal transporter [Firmicutes bacterium]|nr:ZIP family metal transporter [Bacillota bacterium]